MMVMNKNFNAEVGKRIRRLRESLGKTREQIAEDADISPQFLFYIETGRKSMSARTIVNLSRTLRVSTDYILLGDVSVNNVGMRDMPDGVNSSRYAKTRNILRVLDDLSTEKLTLAEKFLEDFSIGARQK